jgi:hypothetical protein
MNLAENNVIPTELGLSWALEYLDSVSPSSVHSFSAMKYIDRMDFELSKPMKSEGFNNFCDILTNHARFLVENVRWRRSDEYLTVIGATFVRFRPVEG